MIFLREYIYLHFSNARILTKTFTINVLTHSPLQTYPVIRGVTTSHLCWHDNGTTLSPECMPLFKITELPQTQRSPDVHVCPFYVTVKRVASHEAKYGCDDLQWLVIYHTAKDIPYSLCAVYLLRYVWCRTGPAQDSTWQQTWK